MNEPDKQMSVAQIWSWIEEQECNLRLWDVRERGISLWRLLRFPLWLALHEKTGLMDQPHPLHSRSVRQMKLLKSLPKALTLNNPWFLRRHINTVVLPHSRRVEGVEMHARPVLERLKAGSYVALYDDPYANQIPGAKSLTAYLLWGTLARKLGQRKATTFSVETHTLLVLLEANLQQYFGVRVDILGMAAEHLTVFLRFRKIYAKLFSNWQAKALYVVVGYTTPHMAAIDAAHACGMTTTEIQHGSFSAFIPGYSFGKYEGTIPYYPMQLLALGQFWVDSTPLPRTLQTQVIGAKHLHERLGAFAGKPKTPKSILFISQGTIGMALCAMAIEVALGLPEYLVTYRLHPSEDLAAYERHFPADRRPNNFAFSLGGIATHALLAEAEIAAGVYSTGLYEGMLLGCRTILINLPGIEHMHGALNAGDALLVQDAATFCAHVQDAPICANPLRYYALPQKIAMD